jgi:hypothetical protein
VPNDGAHRPTDGLVEFFEELLERSRSEDSVWLVAEVDGQVVIH